MIRCEVVVSGVANPLLVYSKLQYEKFLNGTGVFEIAIPSSGSDVFDLFDDDNIVNFYKSGVLDFKGVITSVESFRDGLMVSGIDEGSFKYSKVEASSQKWLSSDTDTILGVIDGRVSGTSVGTVNNVSIPSFRTEVNQSCLVALSRLAALSDRDWYFDYSSGTKVNVVTHLGSVSSIGVWNESVDVKNVRRKKDFESVVDYIKVIGAGEGNNQVVGQFPSGVIAGGSSVKTIVDKSIMSVTEANKRAEEEYKVWSNPRFSYKFKVLNPFIEVSLGDVLTLNSGSSNASMVDVRVTKLVYVVVDDDVSLSVEVRGTGEREASEDFLKAERLLKASVKDANSMVQPVDSSTANISLTGDITDAPSDTSVSGSVTSAASNTSISGGVSNGASNTDISGSVSTAGTTDNGYFFGSYVTNITANNTWRSVGTGINVGSGTWFFHGIFATVILSYKDTIGSDATKLNLIRLRARNTSDNTSWPNDNGVEVANSFDIWSGATGISWNIPMYIHIPQQWANKTYTLQYRVESSTDLNYISVRYSYHGSQGHSHGNNFGTTDNNHGHGNNFGTTDNLHGHSDSLDTVDNNHGHGDSFSGSDSGHTHGDLT